MTAERKELITMAINLTLPVFTPRARAASSFSRKAVR